MKTIGNRWATALLLVLAPISAIAAVTLGEGSGFLAGSGHTPTHDFEVVANQFSIEILQPNAAGQRTVKVSVPVEEITTGNFARDIHMQSSIFGSGKDKGFDSVDFVATTDHPVAPGKLSLQGQLTINGTTRPSAVELHVTGDQVLTVRGKTIVRLEKYGIETPGMGPMKVSNHVPMAFEIKVPSSQFELSQPVATTYQAE